MRRTFKHVTPRYIVDRVFEILYQKVNPDAPWLVPNAIPVLESLLKPTDVGVEFGSGRSTVWLARRVGALISIEHNEIWHQKISDNLYKEKFTNVDYRFVSAKESKTSDCTEYLAVLEEIEDNSLDFALVDGIFRDRCALGLIPKLCGGGLLIIDNVNWYLPSNSRAPSSRNWEQGPVPNGCWSEVYSTISKWRVVWLSSGVTDTAVFFKPIDLG